MFERILGAAIAALLLCTPAWPHGGGFVVVPVYVGSAAPSLPPAKTGDTSHIHAVALLSAIGETFTVHSAAAGFFGRAKQINIAAWKMDDLAASVVGALDDGRALRAGRAPERRRLRGGLPARHRRPERRGHRHAHQRARARVVRVAAASTVQ